MTAEQRFHIKQHRRLIKLTISAYEARIAKLSDVVKEKEQRFNEARKKLATFYD